MPINKWNKLMEDSNWNPVKIYWIYHNTHTEYGKLYAPLLLLIFYLFFLMKTASFTTLFIYDMCTYMIDLQRVSSNIFILYLQWQFSKTNIFNIEQHAEVLVVLFFHYFLWIVFHYNSSIFRASISYYRNHRFKKIDWLKE